MSTETKITVLQSRDKKYIDDNLSLYLKALGDNIQFNDNKWICNNATDQPAIDSDMTIYFTSIPEEFTDYVKYYVILSENKLNTKINDVMNLCTFLKYIKENEGINSLEHINQDLIERYRYYLDNRYQSKSTKVKKINIVADFFSQLEGWDGIPCNNPVNKRVHRFKRKKSDNEIKTRYIPEKVMIKLDKIFYSNEIPIHFRLFYWICRLYPSRSMEVSSLKRDCIKKVRDVYVLFKNETKSSNIIGESNKVPIYIKYENMGKYLIDLYEEQKAISEELDIRSDERFKGLLFLYIPIDGRGYSVKKVGLVSPHIFNRYLKKICKEKGIDNEIEPGVQICIHSFRHIGITDRLYENFSTLQIRDLTGQKTDSEVMDNYHHRQPDKIKKIQDKIVKNSSKKDNIEQNENNQKNNPVNNKILFRGRILNLDENREKRILSNKRAYRIGYLDDVIGICTDIESCKSGLFDCFKCDEFAPDIDKMDFFKQEIIQWEEKIEYYQLNGNKCLLKRAEEIRKSLQGLVKRIEYLIEEI